MFEEIAKLEMELYKIMKIVMKTLEEKLNG